VAGEIKGLSLRIVKSRKISVDESASAEIAASALYSLVDNPGSERVLLSNPTYKFGETFPLYSVSTNNYGM
jgi:hypothetical protein